MEIEKNTKAYAYWLGTIEGIGNKAKRELIAYADCPQEVYAMTEKELRGVLPASKVKKILESKKNQDVEEEYLKFLKGEVQYITFMEERYPFRLKKIEDAPYGIYVRGEMPDQGKPSVAVVGARQCSEYGKYMADRCGRELAEAGVNVVSGMARGIDGISQMAALRAGGKVYGVLGCGVNVCYPEENRNIYEDMKNSGGILSEYPPDTQPKAQLFPPRNRIISGLADVVLIIEARVKSGSLITADMALEQGREVYVVPGRNTDALSEGCNRLLKQGAGIMLSIPEMLEETNLSYSNTKAAVSSEGIELNNEGVPEGTEKLWGILDYYPQDTVQLQQKTGMRYEEVVYGLMQLCLNGKAKQISAGQYVKYLNTTTQKSR